MKPRKQSGMTLIELVVSITISSVIMITLAVFVSRVFVQYEINQSVLENNKKVLYLSRTLGDIGKYPQMMLRSDSKAIKVENVTSTPAIEMIYYQRDTDVCRDVYEDNAFKRTEVLAENFNLNFYYENSASNAYLKPLLVIDITDGFDAVWKRKVSLKDCDYVGTY